MKDWLRRKKIFKADNEAEDGPLEYARAIGLMTVCLQADMPLAESVIISWQNSKGAIRRILDRSLRRAAMGGAVSLEESIEQDARNLPKGAEWASDALIEFLKSADEADRNQKRTSIEKAHENSLASCRQAIRDDTSSLRVPFNTIFAMGIVLPIIVATILPLWGMVSIDISGWEHGARVERAVGFGQSSIDTVTLIGGLSILMFPIVCIISTGRLIGNRELISNEMLIRNARRLLFSFIFLGALALVIMLSSPGSLGFLLVTGILVIIVILANRLLLEAGSAEIAGDNLCSPFALNSICGRLSQGDHFVRAVLLSVRNSRLGRALFMNTLAKNDRGCDLGAYHLIQEASERDPRIAAKVFRQFSSHLSELGRIENEMRNDLRPIAQSAMVATLVLCPFVLGIVAGFNSFGYLSEKESDGDMQIRVAFMVFVIEMSLTGYWLTKCLSPDGKGIPKMLFDPRACAFISMTVFLASVGMSEIIFS
ncbi:MAG: hypothetical protein QXE18_04605 [Thermoplasmata archaeon]